MTIDETFTLAYATDEEIEEAVILNDLQEDPIKDDELSFEEARNWHRANRIMIII